MKKTLIIMLLFLPSVTTFAQMAVVDLFNYASNFVNTSSQIVEAVKIVDGVVQSVEKTDTLLKRYSNYQEYLTKAAKAVKDSRKIYECTVMAKNIAKCYTVEMNKLIVAGNLTKEEMLLVGESYSKYIAESALIVSDVSNAIKPGYFTMNDKERVDYIDRCYKDLSKIHRSVTSLSLRISSISLERKREIDEYNKRVKFLGY